MNQELDALLCEKHKKIFRLKAIPGNSAIAHFGFECHDGWFSIIDNLCTQIQNHIDTKNLPQVEARQVKEKFGGLRFYHSHGDEIIAKLVDAAEITSETTCEICGEPASLAKSNGWVATRCTTHKNKTM